MCGIRPGLRVREDLDRVSDELITTHGDLAQRRVLASHLRIRFETQPVFIEPPSALVEVGSLALGITGTVIIILTGLYSLHRERSVRRTTQEQAHQANQGRD